MGPWEPLPATAQTIKQSMKKKEKPARLKSLNFRSLVTNDQYDRSPKAKLLTLLAPTAFLTKHISVIELTQNPCYFYTYHK